MLRIDGLTEGRLVRRRVGSTEEVEEGSTLGLYEVGSLVGRLVGGNFGLRLGALDAEGLTDGLDVGGVDEAAEGDGVLTTVGSRDGSRVGIIVGT